MLFVTDRLREVAAEERDVHEAAERGDHCYDLFITEGTDLVETLQVLVELLPVVEEMDTAEITQLDAL